jgi:hypothetical protein
MLDLNRAMGVMVATVLAVGCGDSDDASNGPGGGTQGPATDNGSGATQGSGDPTNADDTSTDDDTDAPISGCAVLDEDLPAPGQPCDEEGLECGYGDDCGGDTVKCQDGAWIYTAYAYEECGIPFIACSEGPEGGDACSNPGEVCDPDGDCQNVLECGRFTWLALDECSAITCETVQPVVAGEPCDLEVHGHCPGAPPCEPYTYWCHTTGWRKVWGGYAEECK